MFKLARNFVRWITGKPKKRSATIVVVGLDNAGKTTMMNCINGLLNEDVTPTVGQTTPVAKTVNEYDLQILDLGGHEKFRQVWAEYYSEMHAVVFVIDSADQSRMEELVREFDLCSHHPGLQNKPLLVFANKQDLPGALDMPKIAQSLCLDTLESCSHKVLEVIAKPSANGGKVHPAILEGLQWVVETLGKNYEEVNAVVKASIEQNKVERARRAEERRKRIEDRKKNPQADEERYAKDEKDESAPERSEAPPMCRRCNRNAATRKCEASKWLPVCDDCFSRLNTVATPPAPPDEQMAMPENGSLLAPSMNLDATCIIGSFEGEAEELQPNAEEVPAPEEPTIICSVCGTNAAFGWKPVCGSCDP